MLFCCTAIYKDQTEKCENKNWIVLPATPSNLNCHRLKFYRNKSSKNDKELFLDHLNFEKL